MKTISDYQQQAKEFCERTNTTISIKYLKTDYYFDEDKEVRDIYTVTIEKGNHRYSFKFGSSIAATRLKIKPTEYDILATCEKYDPGTFQLFCKNYGYDIGEKNRKKVYKAVKEEYLNISQLFNEDELEELREIM